MDGEGRWWWVVLGVQEVSSVGCLASCRLPCPYVLMLLSYIFFLTTCLLSRPPFLHSSIPSSSLPLVTHPSYHPHLTCPFIPVPTCRAAPMPSPPCPERAGAIPQRKGAASAPPVWPSTPPTWRRKSPRPSRTSASSPRPASLVILWYEGGGGEGGCGWVVGESTKEEKSLFQWYRTVVPNVFALATRFFRSIALFPSVSFT